MDENGQTYNINADTVAGAVAEATQAEKLVVLTNTPGILDGEGELISVLTTSELERTDFLQIHFRRDVCRKYAARSTGPA